MNKRKDHLKALFGGDTPADTPAPAAKDKTSTGAASGAAAHRSSSGAVKAMGLSLSSMSREVEDARALRDSLAKGDRVVEIDPEMIDPSLVRDRLSVDENGDEEFAALVESMRENGQQVPVLLRPHPARKYRYQIAYGHRRVRAARQLKKPVQAIIRTLSDDELVLAQGKENTERRNLSFIERAFYADALIRHGFDRAVVQSALSLHKAEMTRLLQVAQAVPADIAAAIGPAPKSGRPRWMALAGFLQRDAARAIAHEEIHTDAFKEADSNERFRRLYERLARRAPGASAKAVKARPVEDSAGRLLAHITPGKKPRLDFDEKKWPGFADYVAEQLPELAERFAQDKDKA